MDKQSLLQRALAAIKTTYERGTNAQQKMSEMNNQTEQNAWERIQQLDALRKKGTSEFAKAKQLWDTPIQQDSPIRAAIGQTVERGGFGPLPQILTQTTKFFPQTTLPISHFMAGLAGPIPAEKIALGQPLPDREENQIFRTAGGVTAAAAGTGGLATPVAAVGFGGALGGAVQGAKNLLEGKPVTEDLAKGAEKGALYGGETAPTFALTQGIVNQFANAIPALKYISDPSIQSTLPTAQMTFGEALKHLGTTGLKRVLKAAFVETPIEGVTYGVKNQKVDQKLSDSIIEETKANLIYNIGFAGVNTAFDARVFAPIIQQSIEEALQKHGVDLSLGLSTKAVMGIPQDLQDKSGITTVYRAIDSTDKRGTLGAGKYFTFDPENAQRYGKKIDSFVLDPEGNYLDLRAPTTLQNATDEAIKENQSLFNDLLVQNKDQGDTALKTVMSKWAQEKGYEGIIGDDQSFGSVVFNNSKLISLDDYYDSMKKNGIVETSGKRNSAEAQTAFEEAINEGNYGKAQTAVDQITDPDLKRNLQEIVSRHTNPTIANDRMPTRYQPTQFDPSTGLPLNPLESKRLSEAADLVQSDTNQAPMGLSTKAVHDDAQSILDGAEVKDKSLVARMKASDRYPEELSKDLTGKYVSQTNVETIKQAKSAIKEDFADAQARAMNPQTATDQAIGMELFNRYMDKGDVKSANIILNATSGTSEGQMVQILSQYDKTSPSGAIKFATSAIDDYNAAHPTKPLDLSEEEISNFYAQAKDIQKMPEGRDRTIKSAELIDAINNKIPSSIADKAITVWKAGLLTAFRTTERNLIGNSIMEGSEIVKDAPAAFIDKMLSWKTGQRTLTLTTKGSVEGAIEGTQKAKDVFMLGYDPESSIEKFDVRHVTWDDTPTQQALKKYTDIVFRTLAAEDKPFLNSSFARSLYDQAGAEAINQGKQGDVSFIEDLVKNPSDEMLKTAMIDSQYATFHDKNIIGQVLTNVKKTMGKSELGKIIGEVVAPFTGVPTSIAGKVVDYSPIGLTKGIWEAGKVAATDVPDLQRQASQDLGRGIIGSAIMALGAWLAGKGLITGTPKDTAESQQWQLEGKQPNSILVNGKWRSINSIGPQTIILLAGAKAQDQYSDPEGTFGKFAGNVGKDILSQSTLAGVQGPLNAITDPTRYGENYLQSQAGSVVPNIIADTSKAADPYQREINSIPDAVKFRVPGLRNTLIPKRDALGNKMAQEPTGPAAFVDLFNSKTPIHNTVVDELARLNNSGFNAAPSKIGKSQTVQGVKTDLTPDQLDLFESQVGEKANVQLKTLISSPSYKGMDDETKSKAIDSVMTQIRKQVRVRFNPEDAQKSGSLIKTVQAREKDPMDTGSTVGDSYFYVTDTGSTKTVDLSKLTKTQPSKYLAAKNQDERFKAALDIYETVSIPDNEKTQVLGKLGVPQKDLEYYSVAKEYDDLKSIYVKEEIEKIASNSKDRQDMLKYLAEGRKEVENKMLVSNGVLDQLAEEGYISKSEASLLKKYKIGEDGTPKLKVTGRGKSAKLKNVSLQKISRSQFKVSSSRSHRFKVKLPSVSKNFGIQAIKAPATKIHFNV